MSVFADEIKNLEAERKHWEMTAGTLRTDLEYMTRERDALKSENQCGFSCNGAYVIGSQESIEQVKKWCNEASTIPEFRKSILIERARAEQAEARLAEYERWQGDAEKVANDVAVKWISEYEPALAPIVSLGQSFVLQTLTAAALTSFAAQAAARQRDEDAKIAESRCSKDTDWDASYWNQACENIAVAIRMGEI